VVSGGAEDHIKFTSNTMWRFLFPYVWNAIYWFLLQFFCFRDFNVQSSRATTQICSNQGSWRVVYGWSC